MSRQSPPALPPQPEDPVPVEHDSDDGDGGAWMVDAWTPSFHFSSISRRSLLALPPQPEDPVPVEHDISDGDGGSWMVDTWTASQYFSSLSPPRLPLPCSGWASVFMGHLPSSPLRSPTGISPLWEFDDEQRLPLQMGPTANCSAAVLEAAPQGIRCPAVRRIINIMVSRIHKLQTMERGPSKDVIFRGTYWIRQWSQLSEEEKRGILKEGSQMLDAVVMLILCELTLILAILALSSLGLKTRGSFLAMIESYYNDNELGDDDAEQTEILRKCPRNSLLHRLRLTKSEQLAATTLDWLKTFLSREFELHTNTETGGSCFVMIASHDDADELGDNDDEQPEIARKRPRNSSPVWLHFSKVLSKDSGKVTARCKECHKDLKGASTLGTSHLLRHLKNVHKKDLSSLSENNGNEIGRLQKDFEPGDTSRRRLKGTLRTKSDVWQHFTKLPSADPGGVMARCNHCKKTLKADSQNGTSHLWRHVTVCIASKKLHS